MKRSIRKAAAFSCVLAIMAALIFPSAVAESNQGIKAEVVLENKYDSIIEWKDSALFLKNGDVDSITDKTEIVMVKPDGKISNFADTKKFDKIYNCNKNTYYSCTSSYLIVGKEGKKALLKEDGNFLNDTMYDDISSLSNNFMAVKEGNKCVVRKLDSTLVKEYSNVPQIQLYEMDEYLFVIMGEEDQTIDVFDKDLKVIKYPQYDFVYPLNDEYFASLKNKRMGIITKSGKEIIPAEYDNIEPVENNCFIVHKENKAGVINDNKKEIIPIEYKNIYQTGNNCYVVSKDKKSGVFAADGKVIIPLEYMNIYSFSYKDVFYFYALKGTATEDMYSIESTTIFNADGSVYFEQTDNIFEPYMIDRTGGYFPYRDKDTGLYGMYDFGTKSYKIDPIFTRIVYCDERCFAYELDGKCGVMTYDKKDIIKPDVYDEPNISMDNNRIIIGARDYENYGVRTFHVFDSNTGKLLFKVDKYDYMFCSNNGMYEVRNFNGQKAEAGLLDENGNEIIAPGAFVYFTWFYDNKGTFKNYFIANKDGEIIFIDSTGKQILDETYQAIGHCSNESKYGGNIFLFGDSDLNFAIVKKNNKYGLIKLSTAPKATGLSLDRTDATLKIGETLTLSPRFTPADAINSKITWISSDSSVASVKDGVITALKAGNVTITAAAEDGRLKATCAVKVTEVDTPNKKDKTAIEEALAKPDKSVTVTLSEPCVLDGETLKQIKDSGKTVTFIIQDSTGLEYSWAIDGASIGELASFDLQVSVTDAKAVSSMLPSGSKLMGLKFAQEGNLPASTTFTINVAETYADGTELWLYHNAGGSLELAAEKLIVKDGEVSVSLKHCSEYVFSDHAKADNTTEPKQSPKTGESPLAADMAVVMLSAAALTVGLTSKKKA